MLGSRRPSALLLTALLATSAFALAGCGGDGPKASAPESTGTATAGATTTSAGGSPTSGTADPTAGGTSTPGAPTSTSTGGTHCATTTAIPDGTWSGPITMTVTSNGGGHSFTNSDGTGRLRMAVRNGQVTGGTWNVRWTTVGLVDTGDNAANIQLSGTITGTVRGSATDPQLVGDWRVKGFATITKPETVTTPVDDTGPASVSLKPAQRNGCAAARGRFAPSFYSTKAAAQFAGKAVWIGAP